VRVDDGVVGVRGIELVWLLVSYFVLLVCGWCGL